MSQNKEKNQVLKWSATNEFVSKGVYKSDIWMASIGFQYSYSLIQMFPFVTQRL